MFDTLGAPGAGLRQAHYYQRSFPGDTLRLNNICQKEICKFV